MTPRRPPNLTKAEEAYARIRGWVGEGDPREMTRLQKMILWATRRATPSLRDLAEEAGISESALSTWRRGTRVPPADAVEVLAAVLRDRSNLLARLAGELEEVAEALWTEEGRQEWLASDEWS